MTPLSCRAFIALFIVFFSQNTTHAYYYFESLPPVSLGPDITQCQNALFDIPNPTLNSGETCEWQILSGTALYFGDLSDPDLLFTVPDGSTATIRYTLYGSTTSYDDITLTNNNSGCDTDCIDPLNINTDIEQEGSATNFNLSFQSTPALLIDNLVNPEGWAQRYGSSPNSSNFQGAFYLNKTGSNGDPHSGSHMIYLKGESYCLSPLVINQNIDCGKVYKFSAWMASYSYNSGQANAPIALEYSNGNDSGGSYSFQNSFYLPSSNSWNDLNWTRVETYITVPDNGFTWADFYFTSLSNTNGVVLDDVCITSEDTGSFADAGDDIYECQNGFYLNANTPASGFTGTWSVESGSVSISNSNNPQSYMSFTSGTTALLKWTVTDGTCTSEDFVSVGYISGSGVTVDDVTVCDCTDGGTYSYTDLISITKGYNSFINGNSEVISGDAEGPMASGGDFELSGSYAIASNTAGSFTVDGDNQPTGLIIGGKVLYSGGGSVQVLSNSYVKVGDISNSDIYYVDNNNATTNTRIQEKGTNYGSNPNIVLNTQQTQGTVHQSGVINFTAAFNDLKNISSAFAELPANGTYTVNANDGQFNMNSSGTNIIYATLDDINNVGQINFADDTPNSNNILIVNILDSGNLVWDVPNLNGISNGSYNYILYNFPNATQISFSNSSEVRGSILAPNAFVNKNVANNINGQVMAQSYEHSGGELHHYPFQGNFDLTYTAEASGVGNGTTDCWETNGLVTLTANNCSGSVLWSTGETSQSIQVNPAEGLTYSVTCTADPNPTNLVSNGGFESGLNDWNNWGNATTTNNSAHVHSGNSAAVCNATSAWSGFGREFIIPANTSFHVDLWAKAENTNASPLIGYKMFDSSWNVIDNETLIPVTSVDYQQYSFNVVTPPNAYAFQLYFMASETNLLYIDDVQGFEVQACTSTDVATITLEDCGEICDNGIDDDGDGLVDCDDPDCNLNALSLTADIINDCNELDNGQISVSVSGGTAPFSFYWEDHPAPTAYWTFNNTTNDISGNDNHENISSSEGTVSYSSDVTEGLTSLDLDGSTYLRYSVDGDFMESTITSFVISTWIKPDNLSGIQYIFDEGGATNGLALRLNNNNLQFAVRDGNTQIQTSDLTFPNDGQFHHVVAYYINDAIALYLDGQKTPDVVCNYQNQEISSHSGNGGIGKLDGGSGFGGGSGEYFSGLIDDFMYFGNTTITEAQVDQIAQNLDVRSGLSAGSYTVKIRDAEGHCYNETFDVLESPAITSTITANTTVCVGEEVTLEVNPSGGESPYQYAWSNGANSSNTITFNANASDTYKVTITDAYGCFRIDSTIVTVNEIPDLTINGDSEICANESTQLNAEATINSNPVSVNYLWSTGSTSNPITVNPITTTTYTLTVTTSAGCTRESSIEVVVNEALSSSITSDQEICQGESVNIESIPLSGQSPYTYNWNSGQSNSSFSVSPNVTTTYTVTITDANGCSDVKSSLVTVGEKPSINMDGIDTICVGSNAIITVSASTSENPTINNFVWSTGETANYINVSPVTTTDYTVTVTSDYGCQNVDTFTVYVFPPPDVSISIDGSECFSEGSSLTADHTGGLGPFNYSWSGPNGFSASTQTITIPENGNFYVTVTDANGCPDNTSAFIYEEYEPFIFTLNSDVCEGENVSLSVNSSNAVAYQWDANANNSTSSNVTVTPAFPSTTYTVTVTNDVGCTTEAYATIDVNEKPSIAISGNDTLCIGSSLQMTSTTPGLWTSSDENVFSIDNSGLITGSGNGSAIVEFESDQGCASDPSEIITVLPYPVVAPEFNEICIGQSISISSNLPGTFTSSDSGIASISGNTITGVSNGLAEIFFVSEFCGQTQSFYIEVGNKPGTYYEGPKSICLGDTTQLLPKTSGTWKSNDPSVASVDNFGKVISKKVGLVTFTYTTSGGCKSDPTEVLTINEIPTINVPAGIEICFGESIDVSNGETGIWNSNDTEVGTIDNNGLFTGVNPGTTTVTVSSAAGCTSSDSEIITVLGGPTTNFIGEDSICVGELTTVSPSSNGTWYSSNTSVATIDASGNVTSHSAGTTDFTFLDNTTGCFSPNVLKLRVFPTPTVTITGEDDLCLGETTSVSASTGGTFTCNEHSVAVVDNFGHITTLGSGIFYITFYPSTGNCSVEVGPFTVHDLPQIQLSGEDTICVGTSTNLLPNSGGTWESSNISIATISNTGVVTGNQQGTVFGIFTDATTGCESEQSVDIIVEPKPSAKIQGDNIICQGETTQLSPSTGGSWTSQNNNVATISSSGLVTGNNQGLTKFIFTSDAGCSSNASAPVIVNSKPDIQLPQSVLCLGETLQLQPAQNGNWISSDTSVATVNMSGQVSGITSGFANFSFEDTNTGCTSDPSEFLEIAEKPSITLIGNDSICIGGQTFINASENGTFISLDESIATIDEFGTVTGISNGWVSIDFIDAANGCNAQNTIEIYVNQGEDVVFTGETKLCIGENSQLLTNSGGNWYSTNTSVAVIDDTGFITAITQGSAQFYFVNSSTGCISNYSSPLTVYPNPLVSLTGPSTICIDGTTSLNPQENGSWSVSDTSIATVEDGIVTGKSPGTVSFSFINSNGCYSDQMISVTVTDGINVSIEGDTEICLGYSTQLSPSSGGFWTSSNPKIASVSNTGLVKGRAPGIVTFEFVSTNGDCILDAVTDEIMIRSCTNDDFNVGFVNMALSGDVSTNDKTPLNTSYSTSPTLISKPQSSIANLMVNSDGSYTFTGSKKGKYIYKIGVCIPPYFTSCRTRTLEITLVEEYTTKGNIVANLEYGSTFSNTIEGQAGNPIQLDVLNNDRCVNGQYCEVDTSSFLILKDAGNGYTTYNSGVITYTPNTGYYGLDTIKYQICTIEGSCANGYGVITISHPSAENTIVANDDFNYVLRENTLVGNVIFNDHDPDFDYFDVTPQGSESNPVEINGGSYFINASGEYTFTPNEDFVGSTEFIYTICDVQGNCVNATVHLLVLDFLSLKCKVYLEGALIKNTNEFAEDGSPLMRDDLRFNANQKETLLPLQDPYTHSYTTYFSVSILDKYNPSGPGLLSKYQSISDSAQVLSVSGQNAIVDWIYVELRSKEDKTVSLGSRSGLLQRDGDIVDIDGVSSLKFEGINADSFYVYVKHRNHLGVLSGLVGQSQVVDFRNLSTEVFDFGTTHENGLDYTGLSQCSTAAPGYNALWAGDFDSDGKLSFIGGSSSGSTLDINVLYQEVLFASSPSFLSNYNAAWGYSQGDFDMDGKAKFTNPDDDTNLLYGQILFFPLNVNLQVNFSGFIQQVP